MTYEPAHEAAPPRADVHDTHEETGLDGLGMRGHHPGHRRARKRRGRGVTGCLTTLVVLGLIVGGLYLGLTKGVAFVRDQFADPEDYPGPGTGSVTIEVEPGDTATDIGRTLEEADVVASVEAFTNAANGRADEAATIQAGFYEMRKQMSASDAL